MKVTEIDIQLDLDAAYRVPSVIQPPRTPGLHASDLYGGLYQELDPERYPKGSKPHTIIMAIGLAWEQWLERTLIGMGEAVARPGEFIAIECGRPIIYSPDLVIVNGHTRIGEIKSTCMSAKQGIDGPKMDKYHAQAKLYCHWTETPYARFYVLFLRGDYKFMKKGADKNDDGLPELHGYDIEYTARELHDNHLMHLNYAKRKGLL